MRTYFFRIDDLQLNGMYVFSQTIAAWQRNRQITAVNVHLATHPPPSKHPRALWVLGAVRVQIITHARRGILLLVGSHHEGASHALPCRNNSKKAAIGSSHDPRFKTPKPFPPKVWFAQRDYTSSSRLAMSIKVLKRCPLPKSSTSYRHYLSQQTIPQAGIV